MKKLYKKIKENMKYKEKDENKKNWKRQNRFIVQIKSKWKEKSIKNFAFQNQKIIEGNNWFLLIYFSKFKILIFKYYFKFYNILKFINYVCDFYYLI